LYGHIVAGVAPAGANIAYIIPAWKIFEDISLVIGPIELFTNVIAQGVEEEPFDEPFKERPLNEKEGEEISGTPEGLEKGKAVSFVIDDH